MAECGTAPPLRGGVGSVIENEREAGRHLAVQVVAGAMASYQRGDLDALAALVHPQAEIEMLFLGGNPAHGPDELVKVLTHAREGVHQPTMTSVEELGPDAALMIGRIQYTDQRGSLTDRKAVWLTVLRDGLLWRTKVFESDEEARAYYTSLTDELERSTG
jgi:SnoaL-like protein